MSLPIATPTSVCATAECAAFYAISKPTPSDKRKWLDTITFAKPWMSLFNPFHGRTGFLSGVAGTSGQGNRTNCSNNGWNFDCSSLPSEND